MAAIKALVELEKQLRIDAAESDSTADEYEAEGMEVTAANLRGHAAGVHKARVRLLETLERLAAEQAEGGASQ